MVFVSTESGTIDGKQNLIDLGTNLESHKAYRDMQDFNPIVSSLTLSHPMTPYGVITVMASPLHKLVGI